MSRTARSGFTLIELLVVIAIIALLAAILFPVFARARENARKSTCQSNLKEIGIGIMQYTQDYDETFPRTRIGGFYYLNSGLNGRAPWHLAILPYTKSLQIYKCPSNSKNIATQWSWDGYADVVPNCYLANGVNGDSTALGGKQPMGVNVSSNLSDLKTSSQVILVGEVETRNNRDPEYWDTTGNNVIQGHLGTTNFLFCDGHVKTMKPVATGTPLNMWDVENRALPTGGFWLGFLQSEEARISAK